MSSQSVGVRLQGREYQIRSDADPEWLRRVASYVDAAMTRIREETKTVDSLDVAMLTSLNLAREVVDSRARAPDGGAPVPDPDAERLKSLIELVESVGAAPGSSPSRGKGGSGTSGSDTPLLTLPAGDELDGLEGDLLAPIEGSRPSKVDKAGRG